ncbi:hypothetical protein HID58_025432 [Brassica napus]|uniref:DUF287 domain-containing protein n=1 Tax=Brassica napus TaxID=3708 RepID=A0ABQ8CL31_BRANA|nr:hypothetical protein HID58_025432 [Brassica napus]
MEKKKTTKKSGKSTTAPVAEELSDENNSDDMCDPPSEGLKRKCPSTGGGVSSRTRARKAVSNGNEPVREESNPVSGTTVVSLSLDTESEGIVLVPTVNEETLLARIIDPEPEYHCEGSTSDRWNYWLNVKHKKIWWKELYESDVAARKFTKTKDKEKVTIVEGSSSNSGLDSMLKGVEERILKAMEEGFSGINLTVETKLEAMNLRMGKLEKNQDHGKDREMAEAEKDKEKAETGKKISEKGEEDEENSGNNEEDEENSEKGEEEEDQEPEKDKENNDSVEKGEEYVETIDDESEAEKEAEKEAEEEGGKEGEEETEKEVQEEKEGEEEGEEEGEKEAEKEVQKEKEAEKEESKGTPTSTGVITEIAELAEKEAEVEATHTVQEAIQTEIVEKEAEDLTGGMYFSVGCYEFDTEEEEKAEERENNLVESPSEKHAELAEKSVESDVDQDVEEEEEKAEKIEDNPVESPAKKQTELAEKSVEVEIKTMCKPRVKVIAVQYGIPRAERLAKMRAEAEKRKLKLMVHLRRKTEATLKPCTPLPEKRKGEPSRWVQSPFAKEKTDELEVPKKKLKIKT